MTDDTDAELVAGVRRGDRTAAGRLVARWLRPCRAVALSIVGDEAGAEDVCQDAFVYAMERIDDCRKPDRFGAWLMQIVRNRGRNHVRDRRAGRTVPLDAVPLPAAGGSPHRDAERAELRDRLLSALAQLSGVRREVVLLHDLEGWTQREIAERLDIPQGTVGSHLHHGRRALRDILSRTTERDA